MVSVYLEKEYDVGQLEELARIILTEDEDPERMHYAIIGLRKLLSLHEDNPIQQVIDLNLSQKLVDFMDVEKFPHIMLEATWCCCNISTGTTAQIQKLVDKGLIPKLVKLLACNAMEIFEQASWCVANVAADCPKFKNLLIESGVIQPLAARLVTQTPDVKMTKQIVWALANVCRGKHNTYDPYIFAAPAFIRALVVQDDIEILADALMGLADICNESLVKTICESPLLNKLKEISVHRFKSILIPLLRILAYVTNGDDRQTQAVIDSGFLDLFYDLLNTPTCDRRVHKEVLWIISNITIGTPEQINAAVVHNNRYATLLTFANSDNTEIKKEATWALCNATKHATPEQIRFMVGNGLILLFNDLLRLDQKDEILLTVLEAFKFVLDKAEYNIETDQNPYVEIVFNIGMVDKLELMQEHQNSKIYDLSVSVIQSHFDLEDDF